MEFTGGLLTALTLAFLAYFIAKLLRLPELSVLLLVAALSGPYGFHLVSLEELESFSSVGVIFLLFMIGLEFKTSSLKVYGLRGLNLAVGMIALVSTPLIFMGIFFFNLSIIQAVILGFTLSITSTAIFHEITKKLGVQKKSEVKGFFTELIWEDIFAVFALLLISSYISSGSIQISFLFSLAFFTIPYLFVNFISKHIVQYLPKDAELYFLFFIAIAGVLVIISQYMQIPTALAAFLAGSIAANYREIEIVKKRLDVLSSVFILLFFFSLGMGANLATFFDMGILLFMGGILFITIIFKMFAASYLTLYFGSNEKQAALTGLIMVSIGEFSLLIANQSAPLFQGFDIVTIVSGVVFLSYLVSWDVPKLLPQYTAFLKDAHHQLAEMRKKKNIFLLVFGVKMKDKIEKSNLINKGYAFLLKNGHNLALIPIALLLYFNSSWFVSDAVSLAIVQAIAILLIFYSIYSIMRNSRAKLYKRKKAYTFMA